MSRPSIPSLHCSHAQSCPTLRPQELWPARLLSPFLRQEYWSGLPFPTSGDLPDPGIKPESLYWQLLNLDLPRLIPSLQNHIFRCLGNISIWTSNRHFKLLSKITLLNLPHLNPASSIAFLSLTSYPVSLQCHCPSICISRNIHLCNISTTSTLSHNLSHNRISPFFIAVTL